MLTQSKLKEQLSYDPSTGLFTRLVSPNGKNKVGEIAGTIEKAGYISISVLGKSYKAHRLAWLYMKGCMPEKHIDHINGIKSDNRFENLREVSVSKNMTNKTIGKNNKTGKVGVVARRGKYEARITVDGVRVHLGTFTELQDAVKARLDAEDKYGFTTKDVVPNTTKFESVYTGRGFASTIDSDGCRTKEKLIRDIYNNQKSNSINRGHRSPEYTLEELTEWLMSQTLFHTLYSEWKNSGQEKRLIPSVDRKCDDVHYCMSNIQLMTFGENEDKYKAGKLLNGKGDCKAVECYDGESGEWLATYHSQAEAARCTDVSQSSIAKQLNIGTTGKRKLKYIWKYKEN